MSDSIKTNQCSGTPHIAGSHGVTPGQDTIETDSDSWPRLDHLIRTRRSIRKFRPDMPDDRWIADIIRCAVWAPSPSNSQPVRFFRITSSHIRQQLRSAMNQGKARYLDAVASGQCPKRLKNWIQVYWRYSIFMLDAPVLLAVGTLDRISGFSWRLFEAGLVDAPHQMHHDLAMAAGMAIQSVLLKARELGLGTCVLTAPLSFMEQPETILGIDDVHILGFIAMGFPDESPVPPKRKSLSEWYREL